MGLTAALKLSETGSDVVLCSPPQAKKDMRTTALLMQSVAFLEELGIWEDLKEKAFPLKIMRIVDGTNRLIRAPQTEFNSAEIELEAFGYNIRNQDMLKILIEKIEATPNITVIDSKVESVSTVSNLESIITLKDEQKIAIDAGFVVGADGRDSIVRHDKQVTVRDWEYPQEAMVVDFNHERSTRFTSTEFHTESGPFTIVPHTDKTAGLVWMERPEKMAQLMTLSDVELAQVIEEKMQSYLGKITLTSKPQSFPMKGLVANRFGDQNYALVGEAAHVFPPIGAQGFNLGIRDIQSLSEVFSRYTNQENRGAHYDKARRLDVNSRTYGVDLLNRSLISDFFPTQIIRGLGLHALGSIAPLRKYVMKMGISPNL